MQDGLKLWTGLDTKRRLIVVAATMSVFLALFLLARVTGTNEMVPLYDGLDSRQSAEIIDTLQSKGFSYEIAGNSLLVDRGERDSARIQLAADGLPRSSAVGYELLDGLSGFGTTSQMFDAAFWRAKEGELARTISSSPDVRQVRVHIAVSSSGGFRREFQPSASVTVLPVSSGLSTESAEAFRYLVAYAVPNLSPESVTVIDSLTGRMVETKSTNGLSQLDANSRVEVLKANVERILFARLGYANAVVEVAMETIRESEKIRERRLDPESRVTISTDLEEVISTTENNGGSSVTVASNLPDGEGGEDAGQSSSQNSETRSTTNFDMSEVVRNVDRQAGAIRRLTVAVLINSDALTSMAGEDSIQADIQERQNQELESLKELVQASVGFDNSRGDIISIQALPFQKPVDITAASRNDSALIWFFENRSSLIQVLSLAFISLVLSFFVIRPLLLSGRNNPDDLESGSGLSLLTADSVDGNPSAEIGALHYSSNSRGGTFPEPESNSDATRNASVTSSSGAANGIAPLLTDGQRAARSISVSRLKEIGEDRQSDAIAVLRSWLGENVERENLQ